MIKIFGSKGKISDVDIFLKKISDFSKKNNVIIQSFNADLIFGKNHLISSVKHAKRAFEDKTNTCNSIEMEILLYASGKRQLKHAIPKMGVKKGNSSVVFVILDERKKDDDLIKNLLETTEFKRDDKVIQGDINTLKKFGFKNNEIKTVSKDKYGDLILEKVAMVDIIK
jgi:KEOPS complex subunit Cgi121